MTKCGKRPGGYWVPIMWWPGARWPQWPQCYTALVNLPNIVACGDQAIRRCNIVDMSISGTILFTPRLVSQTVPDLFRDRLFPSFIRRKFDKNRNRIYWQLIFWHMAIANSQMFALLLTIDNQLTQKFYVVDKKFSGWLSRDSFSPMIDDKTKDVEIW